ncbi:MAG TPA: hypothetical protein PKI14_01285 [Fervidobacterium sp.]|nr:hypothetical protein [Fervidobacterium sp.]
MKNIDDELRDSLIYIISQEECGFSISHMFGIVARSSQHRSAINDVLIKMPGGSRGYGHSRISTAVEGMLVKDLKKYETN